MDVTLIYNPHNSSSLVDDWKLSIGVPIVSGLCGRMSVALNDVMIAIRDLVASEHKIASRHPPQSPPGTTPLHHSANGYDSDCVILPCSETDDLARMCDVASGIGGESCIGG